MAKTKEQVSQIAESAIIEKVYFIRGVKVMMDKDLAQIYGTETFRLNEAVKRNISRFPPDFMFQLTHEEFNSLISHSAISKNTERWNPETSKCVYRTWCCNAFVCVEFRNSYPGKYSNYKSIHQNETIVV